MKKFKKIYIEITNICNLKCDFCPTTKRKNEEMTVENFQIILQKIKPFTNHIYLHVKGEPLFHSNIKKLLNLAHNMEFNINITTNGTLISEYTDFFSNEVQPRQINFSLHSFDNTHDTITPNKYLKDIFLFSDSILLSKKTYVSLRLWNFNKDDKNSQNWEKNNYILKEIEKHFKLEYEIAHLLTPGIGLKIGEKLYINSDYEFIWPTLDTTYFEEKGFCYALRNQIAILVDGTVVPCCLDNDGIINLGNIFKTEFSEILKNKKTLDIYNGFSQNNAVEELCKKCQFKEKFI